MSIPDIEHILDLLQHGELNLAGLVPWGSNYTFLVNVCRPLEEVEALKEIEAIYKPRNGERPLWDFPRGTLCQRERVAFLVSEALGWHLVPPTVLRDGPHGLGSVQYFVEHDPDEHYFTFAGQYSDQLQRVALFDILINNADRKGSHILLDNDGRLWSIDHGICFHTEHKLRSVIWDFAGQPIPADLTADLQRFDEKLEGNDASLAEIHTLLSAQEVKALRRRLTRLLASQAFPHPGPGRHYPWPPV